MGGRNLNVRRLMYQSLIWLTVLRNDACRLGAALDTQDLERAANTLVDPVWGDAELGRDFLRGEMLVHQPQAIELSRA